MTRRRILVADDNYDEVKELIRKLENDYEVTYVPDGKQAKRRILEGGFDAAVLDMFMAPEDMNPIEAEEKGYCTGAQILEYMLYVEANPIPIVINSASSSEAKQAYPHLTMGLFHDKENGIGPIIRYLQKRLGL